MIQLLSQYGCCLIYRGSPHHVWRRAAPRYVIKCYVLPCYVIPCYAIPCYVTPCYVIPCYVILSSFGFEQFSQRRFRTCRVLLKSSALAANAFLLNLQDYILPIEYVNTMRDYMLDKCPVSSYKDIAEVIEEDLGRKPEELFASIEQVPIASASLAQVQTLTFCMHACIHSSHMCLPLGSACANLSSFSAWHLVSAVWVTITVSGNVLSIILNSPGFSAFA